MFEADSFTIYKGYSKIENNFQFRKGNDSYQYMNKRVRMAYNTLLLIDQGTHQ